MEESGVCPAKEIKLLKEMPVWKVTARNQNGRRKPAGSCYPMSTQDARTGIGCCQLRGIPDTYEFGAYCPGDDWADVTQKNLGVFD